MEDVGLHQVTVGEAHGISSALEAGITKYREGDVTLSRVGNLIRTSRWEIFNLQGVGHEATIGQKLYGDAFMEAVSNNGEPVIVTAAEIARLMVADNVEEIIH